MAITVPARLFVLASPILLGACAQTTATRYPSLLPRAIERRSDAEPVAPVVAVESDPALDARIADADKARDAGARNFKVAATRADAAGKLARGAAVGSDRWLAAQTALAELGIFRATSSGLVTDLEELSLARAADGKPPYPSLNAAREAAQAALDLQTARIGTLQAAVPAA